MSFIANIVLPGTGLVVQRREWLGLAMTLLFASSLNLWIAGSWIAPRAMPGWIWIACLTVAILTWVFAQVLFIYRRREIARMRRDADALLSKAETLQESGDVDGAIDALETANAVDTERPDLMLRLAQLLLGRGDTARSNALFERILDVAPRSAEATAARNQTRNNLRQNS